LLRHSSHPAPHGAQEHPTHCAIHGAIARALQGLLEGLSWGKGVSLVGRAQKTRALVMPPSYGKRVPGLTSLSPHPYYFFLLTEPGFATPMFLCEQKRPAILKLFLVSWHLINLPGRRELAVSGEHNRSCLAEELTEGISCPSMECASPGRTSVCNGAVSRRSLGSGSISAVDPLRTYKIFA